MTGCLTGQSVAAETIRQQTEQVGTTLEVQQQADIAQVQQTGEAAVPVDPAPGTLLVEADGVMVRYRDGWHEAKVGVIAGWDERHSQAPEQAVHSGRRRAWPFMSTQAMQNFRF